MIGKSVTSEELAERMKTFDVKLIDVRSQPEYVGDLGHIEGAINIPVGEMANEIKAMGSANSLQKDSTIVTICRTHNRSPRAARMLRDAGFSNVLVLKDGMTGWKRKDLPVVR
jgi:rhodanese-related sulfurtransferase